MHDKIINVLEYGADPTHTIDSNAAFEAALAAWLALGGSQKNIVRIPGGHYINSKQVSWGACPVVGDGTSVTIIDPTMTDGSWCFIFNADLFRAEAFSIQTGLLQAEISRVVAGVDGYCGGVQAGVFNSEALVTFTLSTNQVNAVLHPYSNGDPVQFETAAGGAVLPVGIVAQTTYWVINKAINSFKISATKSGIAANLISSGSGTIRAFSSARRGRMDVRVQGCWKSVEADGWQNSLKIWADNCGCGPRVSQQNGSTLDLVAESCLQHGEIKNCKGAHFIRVFGSASTGGNVTATSSMDGNHGAVINSMYFEGDISNLRSSPNFSIGVTDVTYGLTVNGFNGQADATFIGVPPMIIDKIGGGEINGFVAATAGNIKLPRMGVNNVCLDISRIVPKSAENSPFGFQSSFEVLYGATSCAFNPLALNPLPYFEHRGGHVYRPSDTRSTSTWIDSSRIPGTYCLRVKNALTSGVNTSYVQHSINSNKFQKLNGKYVLAVAIMNIPEHLAYGSAAKTDSLNLTTYKPGFELLLQNTAGNNLAIGTDLGATSQQKHRRGTIQAYASFINASALTSIQRVVFNFYCVRGPADLSLYTDAYVDVEAVFLFEVPNMATAAAVIPQCFRTDLQTLNRDSVIEAGRLVTNNLPNPITASSITYDVGDLVRLIPAPGAPDHKICTTAGNYTTAVFKNSANLSV